MTSILDPDGMMDLPWSAEVEIHHLRNFHSGVVHQAGQPHVLGFQTWLCLAVGLAPALMAEVTPIAA
jgi:hypothetical protein